VILIGGLIVGVAAGVITWISNRSPYPAIPGVAAASRAPCSCCLP
jgi:hypothetical protein